VRAIVLRRHAPIEQGPLEFVTLPDPIPSDDQVLIKVSVCGLCHTDLDEIEGRLRPPKLPIVLGHQVVGSVVEKGPGATRFQTGDRVGITWLYSSCGQCAFCRADNENLCDHAT
jgi:propanol-preferring alcohol dehydrogenase